MKNGKIAQNTIENLCYRCSTTLLATVGGKTFREIVPVAALGVANAHNGYCAEHALIEIQKFSKVSALAHLLGRPKPSSRNPKPRHTY